MTENDPSVLPYITLVIHFLTICCNRLYNVFKITGMPRLKLVHIHNIAAAFQGMHVSPANHSDTE